MALTPRIRLNLGTRKPRNPAMPSTKKLAGAPLNKLPGTPKAPRIPQSTVGGM